MEYQCHYKFTPGEYFRAKRKALFKLPVTKFIWLLVGISAVYLLFFKIKTPLEFVTVSVVVIFGTFVSKWMRGRQLRLNPGLLEEIVLTINDEGVREAVKGSMEVSIPWSRVRRIEIDKRDVCIYYTYGAVGVVPKKFLNEEMLQFLSTKP